LLLGEKGENDFKVVQMILKRSLRKEIQKKIEKGKGALAGRGLTSGPLAEASPAHPRSPLPRACASARAASARADGRAVPLWCVGRA